MAMFWFSEVSNVLAWVISATWECLYEIIDGIFSKKSELYYSISLVLVHIVVTLFFIEFVYVAQFGVILPLVSSVYHLAKVMLSSLELVFKRLSYFSVSGFRLKRFIPLLKTVVFETRMVYLEVSIFSMITFFYSRRISSYLQIMDDYS